MWPLVRLEHEPVLTGPDGGPYAVECSCHHWRPPQVTYTYASNALQAYALHRLTPNEPTQRQQSGIRGFWPA